ncbi:hypothetical protein JCM8097_001592 [Rhodosporidiobolus ruineniae]
MVDVALIGVGLVGKEVVRQLTSSALSPFFRIAGLSNSRHTVTIAPGAPTLYADTLLSLLPSSSAPLPSASSHPAASYSPANPSAVLDTLIHSRKTTGRAAVFVDCTSELSVAELYPRALSSGISVVTPNKKGFASNAELYKEILQAQAVPGAGLCYAEATVGAGLPIHSTLRDLLVTGDEVTKIEGVFSGTLSYLLNQYSPAEKADGPRPKFSEILREAKEHGHTEPHPADDLSGADVARKLTILARLVSTLSSSSTPALPSLPDGYKSVDIQSLVPPALDGVKDAREFVAGFEAYDSEFDRQRDEAAKEGKVLRYVGVIDRASGTISCKLEKYPLSHPFASLSGSHLSIAFYTKRYAARPLIVQGPGYPLAVTASAVVGDLIRVAERNGARLGL